MAAEPAGNAAVIDRFYDAFSRRDGETMAACYAPTARFSDPVFTDLEGAEVGAMWKMLCERGKDLVVVHSEVAADGDEGSAHWEADYTFGGTGRKVHNVIDATFKFQGGMIVAHEDRFSFYSWARQALGPAGLLLGWSPPIQGKIRAQAREGLDEFIAGHAAPADG